MLDLIIMSNELDKILLSWKKPYIKDTDLEILLPVTANARYGLVKRALKKGRLTQLKRGLYQIHNPYQQIKPSLFEIAQLIYGPSYISLLSALSYHQWIPEAVYTTTSVTPKRSNYFETPIGDFSFSTCPVSNFYVGVERVERITESNSSSVYLMATPWKALADYYYVYKPDWKSSADIEMDLRIDVETLATEEKGILKAISMHYNSPRVRTFFGDLRKDLEHEGY